MIDTKQINKEIKRKEETKKERRWKGKMITNTTDFKLPERY